MSERNKHRQKLGTPGNPFNNSFPIKVETYMQPIVDPLVGSYDQYIVAANGMVIAHFLSLTSRDSYLQYLKKYGFKEFDKKIMDILEYLATGKKPINPALSIKK